MIFLSATSGELAILDWIQEHMRCDVLDWFLPRFTLLANSGIFWVFVTLLLLSIKPYRSWGVEMAIALTLCLFIGNGVLKPLIARVRPFDANPAAPLIATPPTDYSFPSGHTYSSFAAATVLLFHKKSRGAIAVIMASIIAFSRIYLYFHYPSDVLAGMILGIAIGALAHYSVQIVQKKRHAQKG